MGGRDRALDDDRARADRLARCGRRRRSRRARRARRRHQYGLGAAPDDRFDVRGSRDARDRRMSPGGRGIVPPRPRYARHVSTRSLRDARTRRTRRAGRARSLRRSNRRPIARATRLRVRSQGRARGGMASVLRHSASRRSARKSRTHRIRRPHASDRRREEAIRAHGRRDAPGARARGTTGRTRVARAFVRRAHRDAQGSALQGEGAEPRRRGDRARGVRRGDAAADDPLPRARLRSGRALRRDRGRRSGRGARARAFATPGARPARRARTISRGRRTRARLGEVARGGHRRSRSGRRHLRRVVRERATADPIARTRPTAFVRRTRRAEARVDARDLRLRHGRRTDLCQRRLVRHHGRSE